MRRRTCALVAIAIGLVGCGDEPPPPKPYAQPDSAAQQAPATDERVQKLGAADAAGYDGRAVQQSVQRSLDRSEAQQRERDAALQAASGQ